MSQRLQIVLSDPAAAHLRELATGAGEPIATLAARIVGDGIARAVKDGNLRALARSPAVGGRIAGRPTWLEPYGGDRAWRQETWGAIVALHGRYPRHLGHLKHGWWNDEAITETLAALAVWRAEIDNSAQDPREELAFHHQLADYANTLRQQSGGVSNTWQPGAPPQEWTQ